MLGRASYSYSVLQCRKKERDQGRAGEGRQELLQGGQTKQEQEKKESLLKKRRRKEMQVCDCEIASDLCCLLPRYASNSNLVCYAGNSE